MNEKGILLLAFVLLLFSSSCKKEDENEPITEPTVTDYPIVDTDVKTFYNNSSVISAPSVGSAFYGQDASYQGNQPSYTDNGNGTITDNVTDLMWQKDMGSKLSYDEAVALTQTLNLGEFLP
jgi:hypothetical protein